MARGRKLKKKKDHHITGMNHRINTLHVSNLEVITTTIITPSRRLRVTTAGECHVQSISQCSWAFGSRNHPGIGKCFSSWKPIWTSSSFSTFWNSSSALSFCVKLRSTSRLRTFIPAQIFGLSTCGNFFTQIRFTSTGEEATKVQSWRKITSSHYRNCWTLNT